MDLEKIKKSACHLEVLLNKCASNDRDAASLLRVLNPLINQAKLGSISEPLEWRDIPGAYFFMEGNLIKYRDLEDAFADFRIEITGVDNSF